MSKANVSANCAELRIPLRDLTLAAKTWGNSAKPPLLALHGWLDNAASFDALAPRLDEHFVVALDLAGHGRSDWRPRGNAYAWVDYLDDISQVFAYFGWVQAGLLGHSLGGTLASVYAAAFPERVDRMILIEALGPLARPVDQTLVQLRAGLIQRQNAGSENRRVFGDLEAAITARRMAGNLSMVAARAIVTRGTEVVPSASPSSDAQRHRLDKADLHTPAASGLRWSSDPRLTLASMQRFSEDQVLALLAGIHAPTLLVLADPPPSYLDPAMIQQRVSQVARIEAVHLTGTHHLHLEDPEPVAVAIHAYLARIGL